MRQVIQRVFALRIIPGTLLVRFSVLSLALLVLIGAGLAMVLQHQMEQAALVQQTNEISVVLESTLGNRVQASDLRLPNRPGEQPRWEHLATMLLNADHHLVRIKVWSRQGEVIYSNDRREIGKRFPLDPELREALAGSQAMDVSSLSKSENVLDRGRNSRLLETYVPLRAAGHVVGAYEAYSDLAAVDAQMNDVRRTLWISVALGFALLYLSLFAVVRAASHRLVSQMRAINALEVEAREAAALREVESLKDELIGSVSHELRRPLASIKGYTEALLAGTDDLRAGEQREFLSIIDEESDHLSGLIDDLLDVARLDSNSLPLTLEPLFLPALVQQVINRLEAQSHLPPHSYEVHFSAPFPVIQGDAHRITQLFLNLLENAAKYAPAGTEITVEGEARGEDVVIRVIDRGPGIAPQDLGHIFDKFYRADSSATRISGGTGLGLAICRGVAEAHGGDISVKSAPGEGSVFTVRLPAGSPAAQSARSA